MDALLVAESLLSPLVLALLGLCIGSFLNVVIHRLPLMLERGWKLESAEMLGVDGRRCAEPITLSRPRSRCPSCGHAIRWYENIPRAQLAVAARPLLGLQDAHLAALPAGRARSPALLFAAVGWRFGAHAGGAAVVRLRRGAGGAGRHRLGHHPAARQPDAAAAVGRPGRQRARLDDPAAARASGARSPATCRCGRCTGCSSSPPARKAWASATSSCSPRSAPGWAGR